MATPSVDELKKAIKGILKGADLDSLSAKKVRKMLEEKFDADFSQRKKEIDKLVMKMIEDDEEEEEEDEEEKTDSKAEKDKDDQNGTADNSDAGSDEEEVPKKKAKKSSSAASSSSSKQKRKSAAKADDSEDPVMSSIKQMDDEDLAKKLQEEESGLRRRRAAAPRPKPRKEREKDPDKKKKPSLYSRPCQLSDQLAAVVGTNEMPRPDVVKTLWSIVKERNLQDPENKQFMLCDAQMETLFGVKRVKLFGMMKHLKKHIVDLPR